MAPNLPSDSARTKSTRAKLAEAWRNRGVSLKALSFGLVGLVNTAVDYGVFLLARAVYEHLSAVLAAFAWLGSSCHCGSTRAILLIAANVTSWLVAVTGSYIMNSSITFAAESGRQWRLSAYATFVVSGIAGLFANTATLVFAAQFLLLPIWFAKAIAILASFIVNFSLSHFVVFRARDQV